MAGNTIPPLVAIKTFFGMESKQLIEELKALSKEEKEWLAAESAKALGMVVKKSDEPPKT